MNGKSSLRLVVERITIADDRIRVETVIPPGGDNVKLRSVRGELVEPQATVATHRL